MEVPPLTVLGIVGSLRRASFNAMLMRCAEALAPEGVAFDICADLGALPHFSQDREGDLTPPEVHDLRARVRDADAVLVATPEYNSSMPGVLKNALDWASRPPGESVLANKPAAAIGTSPGRFGAQRAQAEVRKVLAAIGAKVLDLELPVPRAREVFDEHGRILDAEQERRLAAFVSSLVQFARAEGLPEPSDSAAYSLECQRRAAAG